MIVYNVTTKVTPAIHNNWLQWIKEEHIPDIISTGCFTHATVLQLLDVDDSEGPTFTVQYFTASKSLYNNYIAAHAEKMRQKAFDKWGDQFIAFRSLMQVIN
jgi:hypothetical protein